MLLFVCEMFVFRFLIFPNHVLDVWRLHCTGMCALLRIYVHTSVCVLVSVPVFREPARYTVILSSNRP